MMRWAIGVDPGKTGAAVLLGPEHPCIYQFSKSTFPNAAIPFFRSNRYPVFFERVNSRPSDDPYSAFQFGKNTGLIYGIIMACGVGIADVEPKTWQFEFGLGGKHAAPGSTASQEYAARKRAHKAKAQELFPAVKVTLEIADALLIAEYGCRKLSGRLTGGITGKTKRSPRGLLGER